MMASLSSLSWCWPHCPHCPAAGLIVLTVLVRASLSSLSCCWPQCPHCPGAGLIVLTVLVLASLSSLSCRWPHGSAGVLSVLPLSLSSPHGSAGVLSVLPLSLSSPHGSAGVLSVLPLSLSSPHGSAGVLSVLPLSLSSPRVLCVKFLMSSKDNGLAVRLGLGWLAKLGRCLQTSTQPLRPRLTLLAQLLGLISDRSCYLRDLTAMVPTVLSYWAKSPTASPVTSC